MSQESRSERLMTYSRQLMPSFCLDNGAILAADSDMTTYPKQARDYRYVWPRDAAFVIYAAHELELPRAHDIRQKFVGWLIDRCEGFSENGALIKRYSTNGRHELSTGHDYQPDQAGSLIWVLHNTTEESDNSVDWAIRKMADGLVRNWSGRNFSHPSYPEHDGIQDLWEEATLSSTEEAVFTYTLASTVKGLEAAIDRFGARDLSDPWAETRQSMHRVLSEILGYDFIPWKLPWSALDRQIDASLTGLIWPFDAIDDRRLQSSTADRINRVLDAPGLGIERYEDDFYDGIHYENNASGHTYAGRWPLLAFWHSISLSRLDERDYAEDIYREQLERLPFPYIPEQIADYPPQHGSPSPLAWGHAMFMLASKELGFV